jgi:hypothetical protein
MNASQSGVRCLCFLLGFEALFDCAGVHPACFAASVLYSVRTRRLLVDQINRNRLIAAAIVTQAEREAAHMTRRTSEPYLPPVRILAEGTFRKPVAIMCN